MTAKKYSKNYGDYWCINTEKDIFKNIKSLNALQRKAYDFIFNGNKNFKTIIDTIDNKTVRFIRVSANEYVYGKNAAKLSESDINAKGFYNQKMRMAPSIDDLINNATLKYYSPLTHKSSLFKRGFNSFQGQVKIDNEIFRYIVRIGKSKNDNIFYDLSLEYLGSEKEMA